MTLYLSGRLPLENPVTQPATAWHKAAGTDYVFIPSLAQITATANGDAHISLADVDWTVTAITVFTPGVAADFLASVDIGVPGHFVTDAALDLLQSPDVFGDFVNGEQVASFLGGSPRTLTLDEWSAFSVNAGNEIATGFGFTEAGGSIITSTNAIAVIHSNGTNFVCRSSVDSDVGALIDTAWHKWTIRISPGTTDAIEWFIDDVSQGTLDLREDVFPASWGVGVQAAGTNRVLIGPSRLFYR